MLLPRVSVLAVLVVVFGEESRVRQDRPKRSVANRNFLTVEERQTLLDKHNELRRTARPSASNMKYMRWDGQLEKMAQEWANRCVYRHGQPFGHPAFPAVGQNLRAEVYYSSESAGRYSLVRKVASSVQHWYDEAEHYHFYGNECSAGKVCGHYTQVVWANSEKLGCGISRCLGSKPAANRSSGGYIFVCNYAPAGNQGARTPYAPGKGCLNCPSRHICQDGLCKKCIYCSDKCENGATINDDCICQCPRGKAGPQCADNSTDQHSQHQVSASEISDNETSNSQGSTNQVSAAPRFFATIFRRADLTINMLMTVAWEFNFDK